MGSDSHYERYRRAPDSQEEAEAHAYRLAAVLLAERPDPVPPDELRMAVGEALRPAAVELGNGRALQIPVRRAVRRKVDQQGFSSGRKA